MADTAPRKTGSLVVGIISLVVSVASLAYSLRWFIPGRIKHGLLFAAIFVVLFLFGLIMVRSSGKKATA